MGFRTYEQVEKAMYEYFTTSCEEKKRQLMEDIQQVSNKMGQVQDEICKKIELHEEYICFFDRENQIEIILNTIQEAKRKKKKFYSVAKMLLEVSDDVTKEVLQYSRQETILLIMEYIQKSIDKIGKRHKDTCHKPGCDNTTIFSRMKERKDWKKLYKTCEAAMPK